MPQDYSNERYNPDLAHCGGLNLRFDGKTLILKGSKNSSHVMHAFWSIAYNKLPITSVVLTVLLVCCTASACAMTQDSIDKIGDETDRILAKYEKTKDTQETVAWLTKYHGEVQGHQVMIVFADWAMSHQDDFTKIVSNLGNKERDGFVERFAFALTDSELDDKFRKAFDEHKSESVNLVLAKLAEG